MITERHVAVACALAALLRGVADPAPYDSPMVRRVLRAARDIERQLGERSSPFVHTHATAAVFIAFAGVNPIFDPRIDLLMPVRLAEMQALLDGYELSITAEAALPLQRTVYVAAAKNVDFDPIPILRSLAQRMKPMTKNPTDTEALKEGARAAGRLAARGARAAGRGAVAGARATGRAVKRGAKRAVPHAARGMRSLATSLDAWAQQNPQLRCYRWSNGEYACACNHKRPSEALACAKRCGLSEVQILAC